MILTDTKIKTAFVLSFLYIVLKVKSADDSLNANWTVRTRCFDVSVILSLFLLHTFPLLINTSLVTLPSVALPAAAATRLPSSDSHVQYVEVLNACIR